MDSGNYFIILSGGLLMKQKKKLSLAAQIFIGLGLGIVAGLLFMMAGKADVAVAYVKPFGTIFLNLIKFIVVPIVLCSIIAGVISMKDIRKVGSIGWKTVVYYMMTTACAVVIGLVFANLFKGMFQVLETTNLEYEVASSTNFMDTLVNIFPSNIIQPLANSTMLQVIVIALLFGFGIILAEDKREPLAKVIVSLSDVSMVIMDLILKLSPIGVFCLITPVVAENGPKILGSLAMVLLAAYVCYAIHAIVVYSSTVKAMGGLSPLAFFKGMAPAMIMAFSSASSVGTLPLNMECSVKLGAKKDVASFVLPLGATINMDGAAITITIMTLAAAHTLGISVDIPTAIVLSVLATLAACGASGVAGGSLLLIPMACSLFGISNDIAMQVVGVGFIIGVVQDSVETALNSAGDVLFAATAEFREWIKEGKEVKF